MSKAIYNHTACVAQDNLYIFSGQSNYGDVYNELSIWSFKNEDNGHYCSTVEVLICLR